MKGLKLLVEYGKSVEDKDLRNIVINKANEYTTTAENMKYAIN